MCVSNQCSAEIAIEDIRAKLAAISATPAARGEGKNYRPASVLVPLTCLDGHWHLLFTRRTETVGSHKGQVSFPGGGAEPQDRDQVATALRETSEEIGVSPENVSVLGCLPEMSTISGFIITPVVGCLSWPLALRLEADEVSRAFLVPLRWLAMADNRVEMDVTLPDGRRERVVYFDAYDGEKIWGATARITLNFLKVIGWS